MACRYSSSGNQGTVTSSNKTATAVISIAGLRPAIYGFTIGADGAPNSTDCSMVWTLQAQTTVGTATSVTPYPLDPGYQASKLASAQSNYTIEPTYTAGATPWGPMGINQRASFQIWLPPGGETFLVGTASNGAGMQVKSTNYGGQADAVLYTQE